MNPKPPASATKFLQWFCAPHLAETIQGDLDEEFAYRVKKDGERKARFLYWREVLGFVKWKYIKRKPEQYSSNHYFTIAMIGNYFKIAWRNLLKERQFTLLNLVGLSTGLACTILIYLWVNDELHVDKVNEKDSRLFQIMANHTSDDGIKTIGNTPGLLAEALKSEMPEIESAVTVVPASWFSNKGVISFEDKHLKAGGQFIGKDYFEVFTCPFIQGDKNALFADHQTVAISEDLATKLFHTTDNLIGKTIKWDNGEFSGAYSIGGIFQNNPNNATNKFDMLFNYDLFVAKRPMMKFWGNSDPSTFVILKKEIDINRFNAKIKEYLHSKDTNLETQLFAVNYSYKYLHGQFENGVQAGGRITYV